MLNNRQVRPLKSSNIPPYYLWANITPLHMTFIIKRLHSFVYIILPASRGILPLIHPPFVSVNTWFVVYLTQFEDS